ncbi:MAG TPA: ATP-dependent DNA ligase [Candidatus Saccharimonadales bacterium]|nr:ATP-dependent DNA ligase [Candidatus Saccharimonadales bacterium]
MKFIKVAQAFQKLEEEPSRIGMTKILASLFKQCSSSEIQIIAYLSQGSLFPPYKDVQFQIAQKGMISIIADLVDTSVTSVQKDFKELGDIGLVVQKEWLKQNSDVTVQQVYDELIDIANISGTGSTEKKGTHLRKLLEQVDSLSAKFIVRIVAKALRLGFSDMTVLDALSWMETGDKSLSKDLEAAYNVCADLGLVAHTMKSEGIKGIRSMHIKVGIPIRPAAAERLTSAQEVIDRFGHCVAQPKLDGFRVQVHVKKTESKTDVHFFSRNMLDMSDMFPDLKKMVSLLPVHSLICEGEAIVYDEETESFLPFQETVKRKRKHDVEQMSIDMPLHLYLFDILYLNGKSLLDDTHEQRRNILLDLLKKRHDESLQAVEERSFSQAKDLQDYFLLNIQAGLEGLVVKRQDATYQPGKRNFNWIKLKREAHGSLIDTVDCVILGYYSGRGKRAKFGIGAFLVGIYNQEKEQFQTVAKVGTGLSDDEWKDLKKRCDTIKVSLQPKNVSCVKDLYPDVWVNPELVCVIKSDEITLSPAHTAGKTQEHPGYALRFPRFVSYRPDKSAQDATSIKELRHLYAQQKI